MRISSGIQIERVQNYTTHNVESTYQFSENSYIFFKLQKSLLENAVFGLQFYF